METICIHCHALKFKKESPGMCCSNGNVSLWPLQEPPEPLRSYLSGTTHISRHFLKHIRRYNSSFQMTSFGASNIVNFGAFESTFKVRGQIYHLIGSLLPVNEMEPKFLQIYFMGDDDEEINQRSALYEHTKREIISELQTLLHSNNELVQSFKTQLENMPTDEYQVIIRADKTPSGEHKRRFNAPTTEDIAIVMVGAECENRDIILRRRSLEIERISETNRKYDALQYPLILWDGQDGYHTKIMHFFPNKKGEHTKVSYKLFFPIILFNWNY